MEPLIPFEKLEDDYYLDDRNGWYGDNDNEDSGSSDDDEFKRKISRLAGISDDRIDTCERSSIKRQHKKDEFESDMDDDLNEQLVAHASQFIVATTSVAQKDSDEIKVEAMDTETKELEQNTKAVDRAQGDSVPYPENRSIATRTSAKKVSFALNREGGEAFMNKNNLLRKAAEKMRRKNVNSELADFYDPNEDDDNERWVRQHRERLKIIPPMNKSDDSGDPIDSNATKLENDLKINYDNQTDAVLSCPACMSLLTRDCQRHELYKNQYRAIFVENCKVVTDRLLFLPRRDKKAKRGKKPRNGTPDIVK